ncbi:MAG: endo alpha-1,4 polygalactosaminidase [Spirochaetes bacterium]|nr:endo alpha-1,4 polygalactosaminidase [Spirochaetota bacterium]
MKKIFLLSIAFISFFTACGSDDSDDGDNNSVYKDRMREFVIAISQYAKEADTDFIVIPQNGQELVTADGNEDGDPSAAYLAAIDGVGREDLFYGYDNDNVATPQADTEYMTAFLDICEQNYVEVLTTDYCSDHTKMDDSYIKNAAKNYISFAASVRELNEIPAHPATPNNVNAININNLSQAKNFLYLINPDDAYSDKATFLSALEATDYDLIIMDLFFKGVALTNTDITQLKTKNGGGSRLVIAYMSIGEAEDYRYYWNSSWSVGSPSWIAAENPDWEGNYIVQYWNSEWQSIIFGNDTSYLEKILDAGFDGVYLDIIDAFEYFE